MRRELQIDHMETAQSGLEAGPLDVKREDSWPVWEYCSASMGDASEVLNGCLDHGGLD